MQVVPLKLAHGSQETQFAAAFGLLRRGIEKRAFPGASLAVVLGDVLLVWKAVGRFTYDATASEVAPETVFDLASVTKVVATTAMAMILYQRGLLDLDLPLASVVPEFTAENGDGGPRRRVTLGMLLAHSSGLPAYQRLFERARGREAILRAACAVPLEAAPGTRAEYSDLGFILLGEALSRMAGEPLDCFCRREVFGPLGMAHTGFCPPREWRPQIPPTEDDRSYRHRIIQGEVHDENACAMGAVAGHAGLFSNTLDVAVFAHCMLNGGGPILRPETIHLFTRRPSPGSPTSPVLARWGESLGLSTSPVLARGGESGLAGASHALGWDMPSEPSQSGRYFSPRSYGHLGFTGTSLWIDPERRLAVVLLTNRTWPDRASQQIKQVRPRFHDAVVEALGQ